MTCERQGSTSPGHSKIGGSRKETGDSLLWKQALGNIINYLYTLLWERCRGRPLFGGNIGHILLLRKYSLE